MTPLDKKSRLRRENKTLRLRIIVSVFIGILIYGIMLDLVFFVSHHKQPFVQEFRFTILALVVATLYVVIKIVIWLVVRSQNSE